MIVLSDTLALTPAPSNPLGTPIFGWRSIAESIDATSAADGFPASNLSNPSTALRWRAAEEGSPSAPPAADQYLTATIATPDEVDYLAIAVHNLGSGQHAVSVEGSVGGSPEWFELVSERLLANDDPVIFRFTPQVTGARLRIQPSALVVPTVPFVAVLHVGKLLVLERGTHTDHIPISLARQTQVMNGMSETGNYLGRVVLSESRATTFALQHLRTEWYEQYMDPFLRAAREVPFFFAWRPQERPKEMGYCWLTGDAHPTDQFGIGTKAISLQLSGVAV